ncbi:hypothetical protein OF122_18650 [Pelagibacterium flavum]|uniref:DUF3592 domain-containing protein n=1 Tax=Pelagibacterium flavum TaxID=2984530 RepID=A0ABY6IN43_9HYPH|nr:hypothetical protein [Pelagibacterium sp. YIM 151497]UYQ72028.1 hypothetical protein OF122_18650 [Pelagibacterium sp. YIM 151497]
MIESVTNWIAENWTHIAPLFAVALAWILSRYFTAAPKLKYGRANNSFHSLALPEDNRANIYCEKLYFQNIGGKAATNVQISFRNAPTDISTYPPLQYETAQGKDGHFFLMIPSIAPKELIIIDTIHVNAPTAEIIAVRCSEGSGKEVPFWVLRRYGRIATFLVFGTMLLGAYYALVLLFQFFAAVFVSQA